MAQGRDMKSVAENLFQSAASVLSSLIDRGVSAGPVQSSRSDDSIKIEDEMVTSLCEIPSLGFSFVVRYEKQDVMRIVDLMVGGTGEVNESGAMQMSIVSETVSQITSAIAGKLAEEVGASSDGIKAELVSDATALPPPPFDSFAAVMDIADLTESTISIDLPGVAMAKLADRMGAAAAPAAAAAAAPAPKKDTKQGKPLTAQAIEFTPMAPTPARSHHGAANLDLVHDIPLQISAVLGQTALPLREVVALSPGSVFELDKQSSEPIDLYVNNILIARGEVVVVDDKFAVKISELNPTQEKV